LRREALLFRAKREFSKFHRVAEEEVPMKTFLTVHAQVKGAEADWWRVRTPEGRELGRRVLLHSHVDEQPCTRDEVVHIPREIRIVVVEAHDKVHGLSGRSVTVDLATPRGPDYTVKRR